MGRVAGQTGPAAIPLAGTDLQLTGAGWPFADEHRDEIAALWALQIGRTPSIWDGEILLAKGLRVAEGMLRSEMIRVRFSAYLAWRGLGRPDAGVEQIFVAAVVRGADGGLLFGVQEPAGLEPGVIKPPGGLIDMTDVAPEGTVDIFSTMARELREETGIRLEDGTAAEDFFIRGGAMCSVVRVVDFPVPAADLAGAVRDTLRRQDKPELAEVVVIRSMADLDPARTKPRWLAVAAHVLGVGGEAENERDPRQEPHPGGRRPD